MFCDVPLLEAWNDLSNSPATREDLVRSIEQAGEEAKKTLFRMRDGITTYLAANSPMVQ